MEGLIETYSSSPPLGLFVTPLGQNNSLRGESNRPTEAIDAGVGGVRLSLPTQTGIMTWRLGG